MEITITGLDELQLKLDAIPDRLAKAVLRPALEEAGAVIQTAAEQRAPELTGFTKAHIGFNVKFKDARSAVVSVAPIQADFWAMFSELGTTPHTETSKDGKTWQHPGEPAKPWLVPALHESGTDAIQALADVISDMWDKVTT